MADIPIPVEGKSVFDPDAKRKAKIEKAVQTATDIGGTQVVHEVVDRNLRMLRNELAVKAGQQDRKRVETMSQSSVKPKKRGFLAWLTGE